MEDPTVHAFADTTVNKREQDQHGNGRQGLEACPGTPRIGHAALESEGRKDVVGQREGHSREGRQHELETMTDKQIGKPETGEQEERAENDEECDLFADGAEQVANNTVERQHLLDE